MAALLAEVTALRVEVVALRQQNEELKASKRTLEALIDNIKECVCIDCMLGTGFCPSCSSARSARRAV